MVACQALIAWLVASCYRRPMLQLRKPALGLALVSAGCLALAAPALATTIKVKNHHDSGPGSLRHAIAAANPGDEVVVPADTYKLTSGELLVSEALTIKGAGAKKTIITASGKSRVLEIGASAAPVAISGVTITGGRDPTGGGILNGGTLTLQRDVIRNNVASGGSANYGGGINNTGTLTLLRSEMSSNKTGKGEQGLGGGIAVGNPTPSTGPVTIVRSSLTGNAARGGGFGGAISFQPVTFTQSAGLTITKSTIAHNTATGAPAGSGAIGGAIYFEPVLNSSFAAPLTLTADTFAHNRALPTDSGTGLGGAIFFEPIPNVSGASTPLTLVNDTIAANTAGVAGGASSGGGLYVEPITNGGSTAPQSFTNVTISGNVAAGSGFGGGLHILELGSPAPPPPALENTIVAKNEASTGPDCDSPATSLGHNLERHTSCGLTAAGDLQMTDPLLGPLSDNGGPTQTEALLHGSPAINAGDDAGCPATDQRGVHRPRGPHCEIGAYELRQHHG